MRAESWPSRHTVPMFRSNACVPCEVVMILIELMSALIVAALVLIVLPLLLVMAGVAGIVLLWMLAPAALIAAFFLWLVFPTGHGALVFVLLVIIAWLLFERRSQYRPR